MKKIKIIITTLILLLVCNTAVFAAPYINIKINYDGKTHTYNKERVYLHVNSKAINNLPMEPIIFNNYTLVPARETFENIGASVLWHKATEEIEIIYKDKNVKMKINNKIATVNGKKVTMDLEPKLINSKTMIPVRFVSESVGLIVDWDNKTRIINISEPIEEEIVKPSNSNTINLEKIEMPDSDERTFSIYANKKIEKFEKVLLDDGSVAIDIYNSQNSIKEDNIQSVIDFVSEVTIEDRENNITRFKFKEKKATINNNFLSKDGNILYVNFGGNPIKKIETYTENSTDIMKIFAETPPEINVVKKETENKIIVEVKNSVMVNLSEKFEKINFIEKITYAPSNENSVNIEIFLNEKVNFNTSVEGNTAIIKFNKENNQEEENNNTDTTITSEKQFIIEKNNTTVNINNIKHKDDYLNKKYILTFDKDISSILKAGIYKMNNDLVENILVENKNGTTEIIINCKKLIAVNITEDENEIYINILLPKEKYKDIIVIDPGHGGAAPGTTGSGLLEKDMNLDIALRLEKLFEANTNVKVYFTRLSDVNPSFDDRTNMSNEVGDMFISIHHNSTDKGTGPNGTEVLYLNPNTSDRGLTSKAMAEILQKNLLQELNTLDRKIKTSNLIVLRNNQKPAVLCEIGFLSNPAEAAKIKTPEFRQKAAQAIYNSCIEILKQYPSKR